TGVRGVTLSYEDLEVPPDPEDATIELGFTTLGPALLQYAIAGEPAATRGAASRAERRFATAPIGIKVARDERWALVDPEGPTAAGQLAAVETYGTAAEAHAAARTKNLVVVGAEEAIA